MSALTKIFVVLLVVLSLLLAAASVTYLNTLPNYQSQLTALRTANTSAEAEARRATSAGEQERAALNQRIVSITEQLNAARTDAARIRTELAQAEAEKADLQSQLAQSNTTQSTLSQAVQANTALVDELRNQVNSLRDEYQQTLAQYTETSRQLATTSNDNQRLLQQVRLLQEQQTELQSRNSDLEGALTHLGGDPSNLTAGNIAPPPINGVVLRVDTIGGQPYAMISVGSEDDVQPGMRFTVLENNEFLGYLTVEEVDDTQSIGQLSGPAVNRVSSNSEVRTQL